MNSFFMRKLTFLIALFLLQTSFAQEITPASSFINFLPASELDTVSRTIPISNPNDFKVHIKEIRFYDTYQKRGFSADVDTFSLEAMETKNVEVSFHPGQNVAHNSPMVLLTEDGIGAFAVDLNGQGTFSKSYYTTTQNLSEQALKDALKSRLGSGYVSSSYNDSRNFMFEQMDNKRTNGQGASVNTIECVYTGTEITGWSNRSAAQGMGFNTEHTFPQSLFNQDLPMRSDLFHLFPTTSTSNSQRANFAFGTVSNPSWQVGGSKQGGSLFEPRDQQKGRAARAMFYFVLRYQNYNNYLNSQESILRQWHVDFLPTDIDQKRNDDIFSFQNNRNPFIDYPQFIYRISSISSNSQASRKSLDIMYEQADLRDTHVDSVGTFSYLLVNDGELPVNITNIGIQGSAFQLNFQNDTILAAGDALQMVISMSANQGGMYDGTLNFSTDVSGLTNVAVPLSGVLFGVSKVDPKQDSFIIYPQPADERIFVQLSGIRSETVSIILYDLNGKPYVPALQNQGEGLFSLDVSALPTGIYVLGLDGKTFQKIEVK